MYEVLARKDLLNFVLSKNLDISNKLFEQYNTEYIEPILPKKFKKVEWEILFYKNEVRIKIYD